MFSCTCCQPSKSYTQKKSLFRHERITGIYEDPRVKDARERREAYAQAPKSCEACGVEFSYEDVVHGSKVKYCSRSCAAKTNNIIPKRVKSLSPVKARPRVRHSIGQCSVCSSPTSSREKLYCSDPCKKTAWWDRAILNEESWSAKTRKHYLLETVGNQCQVCNITEWNGASVVMELDHIDGNSSDNSSSNTRLICPNCHSQTPTYKNRNSGKGRHSRRQRYADGKSY